MIEYKEILFATGNKGKLATAQAALNPFGIEIISVDPPLKEIQAFKVREVAADKVKQAYEKIGKPILALDTGFTLTDWYGFPGPFVKQFVSRQLDDGTEVELPIEEILPRLRGLQDRSCAFVEALAFYDGKMDEPAVFEEYVKGTLATEPRGERTPRLWSVISQIFIPEGETKTHAEMTEEELERWRRENYSAGRDSIWKQFGQWYSSK